MAWLFLFALGHTLICLSRTFGAGMCLIEQATTHSKQKIQMGGYERIDRHP